MIDIKIKKIMFTVDGEIDLDIDLKIKKKSLTALFGKSGTGKTTFLRLLAGLDLPDEGHIIIDGEKWFDSNEKLNLPSRIRKTGFLFQDFALFPNMTVRQNIEYGVDDVKKEEKYIDRIIQFTHLSNLANRKPNQLSGGQKQRVALARAVAHKPKILLLDEPMSSLDYEIKEVLLEEIRNIHDEFHITTILVSHDISEVFRLADTVFLLNDGKIQKKGTPSEVFLKNTKKTNSVIVNGKVLSIIKNGTSYKTELLLSGEIIVKKISAKEAAFYKPGKNIIFTADPKSLKELNIKI